MRSSVAMILVGVLGVAGPAVAAVASGPSARDYAKEIQASAIGRAGPPGAACENGEERDDTGACPVIDDSASTRGFTLFSGSMAKPQGPAAKPATPTAAAVRDVRPAQTGETIKCGLVCDLHVSFKTGSTDLTTDSEAKLVKFAESLRDPGVARRRYEIGGHTDASGSPEKNKSLSQARAEAVKAFLVAHGVDGSRLQAKGYGADGLALPNAPNDPRNRRVEARALN